MIFVGQAAVVIAGSGHRVVLLRQTVRGPSKNHAVAVLVPGPTHPDLPGQGVKVGQWSYTTLVDSTPGRLGTTITSLIRHVDQVSYASLPTRWIEDAGGHSNPHHLNIQVDDIRRRIVPA